MEKQIEVKVGHVYVTENGQTRFVIEKTKDTDGNEKVIYMVTGKDVSQGWIRNGTKAQGGTKIEKFREDIVKEVCFTGVKKI